MGVKKGKIVKSLVYELLIPSLEESAQFLSEVFKELNLKGQGFHWASRFLVKARHEWVMNEYPPSPEHQVPGISMLSDPR